MKSHNVRLGKYLLSTLQMAAISFVLFAFSVGVIREAYFMILPGSYFLQAENFDVQSAQVGQPVPFEWCRNPRRGAIKAEITRTFYILDEQGDYRGVSEYEFKPTIEPIDRDCQVLTVSVARQPQVPGTYYFVNDIRWQENGHTKKLHVRGNVYNYSPAP